MIANDGVHPMSRGRRLSGYLFLCKVVRGRRWSIRMSIRDPDGIVIRDHSTAMVNFVFDMRSSSLCHHVPAWDTCHAHATVAYNIYIMFSKYLRRLA